MFQPGVGERKEFLFLYFWTWQICAGNGIKKKEKVPEVKGGEEILLRAGSKAVFFREVSCKWSGKRWDQVEMTSGNGFATQGFQEATDNLIL